MLIDIQFRHIFSLHFVCLSLYLLYPDGVSCFGNCNYKKKYKDIIEAAISCKSINRQYNGQKERDKQANNDR